MTQSPFLESVSPALRELRFAVLDLETTGGSPKARWGKEGRFLPPSEITEVGLVQLAGPVVVARWSSLASIQGFLPEEIQRLTGISLPMLAGAPPWEQVALKLAPKLEGRVWVAHHAPYDGSFLKAWLPEGLWRRHRLICTRLLARSSSPSCPGAAWRSCASSWASPTPGPTAPSRTRRLRRRPCSTC